MDKNKFYKNILIDLFKESVKSADPSVVLEKYIPKPPKGRIVVIGAGKASARMAKVFEQIWLKRGYGKLEGIVLTRYGHGEKCKFIEIIEASHPVPDKAGIEGTNKIINLVSNLERKDLLVFLVSGGGSSLMVAPKENINLKEKQNITDSLLRSGASISEINCVRKKLSRVKGGNLAALAYPAKILTLAISDVPGDDPSVIASGPTFPDSSNSQEALEVIKRYKIVCSNNVISLLTSKDKDNLGRSNKIFSNSSYKIIASSQNSLKSSANFIKSKGFKPIILSDSMEGDADTVGIIHGAIAKQIIKYGSPFKPPLCILSGGETTVKVNNLKGRGGRNTQFLLSLAIHLNSEENIYSIACDTDGIDGVESNAGAIIFPDSLKRGLKIGIHARDYLNRNDAYTFFHKLKDLVFTGPTKTNVNDFRALIITKN